MTSDRSSLVVSSPFLRVLFSFLFPPSLFRLDMDSDPLLAPLLRDAALLSPTAASVPSQSGVIRDVLGVGGVGVGGTEDGLSPDTGTNSKHYSLVKLDRSDRKICFGMIRTGSAFCFRSNCRVNGHLDHKVEFTKMEGHIVVIQRTSTMMAFPEPYLDVEKISDGV